MREAREHSHTSEQVGKQGRPVARPVDPRHLGRCDGELRGDPRHGLGLNERQQLGPRSCALVSCRPGGGAAVPAAPLPPHKIAHRDRRELPRRGRKRRRARAGVTAALQQRDQGAEVARRSLQPLQLGARARRAQRRAQQRHQVREPRGHGAVTMRVTGAWPQRRAASA